MGFNRWGALMSKRRPDKVIEYRISLQDKERELLEHLVYVEGSAKAFNQATEPFVEILKDISAMTIILSAVSALLGWNYIISPGLTEIGPILQDFRAQYEAWKSDLDAAKAASAQAAETTLTSVPMYGWLFRLLFEVK